MTLIHVRQILRHIFWRHHFSSQNTLFYWNFHKEAYLSSSSFCSSFHYLHCCLVIQLPTSGPMIQKQRQIILANKIISLSFAMSKFNPEMDKLNMQCATAIKTVENMAIKNNILRSLAICTQLE